jgi:putative chitinase
MNIPLNALLLVGASNYAANQVLGPINLAAEKFEINKTPERAACFIANCAVETRKFSSFKEDMFYRRADYLASIFPSVFTSAADAAPYTGKPEKLANKVYANRYGNGPEGSGDGWNYRGSGLLQLTFKDNFIYAGKLVGRPYGEQPDLVRTNMEDAALAAGAFWEWKGLNDLVDVGDLAGVSRKINKGMLAAHERFELYKLALKAF